MVGLPWCASTECLGPLAECVCFSLVSVKANPAFNNETPMQFFFDSASLVDELPYSNAASGGGTEFGSLPLMRIETTGVVPDGLEGLLLTADQQGVAPVPSREGALGLLGEAFADWYTALAEQERVPLPSAVGALVAGDMYSDPFARKRGATGDVGPAWDAFAHAFAWTAGVAGNHDLFTSRIARHTVRRSHVALLDGDTTQFDGLRIGGVSGIVGKKGKVNRRTPASFRAALTDVLVQDPHIVVLHEGPPGLGDGQRGQVEVEDPLRDLPPTLLVSGHVHWRTPWSQDDATTHINVDGRAVLLCRKS